MDIDEKIGNAFDIAGIIITVFMFAVALSSPIWFPIILAIWVLK